MGEHKDDDVDGLCDYGCTASLIHDATVPVQYQVEPTYTVTIPATVQLGETATIEAENVVIAKGKQVEVVLADTNDFTVTTARGAELIYTVKNGETVVNEGDIVLTVNPTIGNGGSTTLAFIAPEDVTFAGEYSGTVTFTISVKDAPTDS
jgi:lipopolysaccharide export system protein LptA